LKDGSLSAETEVGMGGTEGVSRLDVLLSIELSGRLDPLRNRLFLREGTLAWPFA
jgi:hypothetical protein